jgi:hypothetical protein
MTVAHYARAHCACGVTIATGTTACGACDPCRVCGVSTRCSSGVCSRCVAARRGARAVAPPPPANDVRCSVDACDAMASPGLAHPATGGALCLPHSLVHHRLADDDV